MAICALVDVSGVVTAMPATPVNECAGFLLIGVEEYAAWRSTDWMTLTTADGVQLSLAIVMIWSMGWVIAKLASLLNVDEKEISQ